MPWFILAAYAGATRRPLQTIAEAGVPDALNIHNPTPEKTKSAGDRKLSRTYAFLIPISASLATLTRLSASSRALRSSDCASASLQFVRRQLL